MLTLSDTFPLYEEFGPRVPVYQISPAGVSAIHRFYDTSPISPSGELIAYTEFDFEDRLPKPGDAASVVAIDLRSGREIFRTRTLAWDTQVGAQAQWGFDDSELFFNRMGSDLWTPYGVKVDPRTGEEFALDGPVYVISPDGKTALSPSLAKIWHVQPGYGVTVPGDMRQKNVGFAADDGLYVTDVSTGASRLALSFDDVYSRFSADFAKSKLSPANGAMYGFHVKWSPDGTRIMFILRWKENSARRGRSLNWIITMDADFSNMKIALDPRTWAGGHHPNWCPDSERIVMNLLVANRTPTFPRTARLIDRIARRLRLRSYRPAYALRFVTFGGDGSDLHPVSTRHLGSGHPTWHPNGLILTDAYPWEPVANGDGTSPLRMLRVDRDTVDEVVRVRTKPDYWGPLREWRIDPHPAWNYQFDTVTFNAYSGGKRSVFVAKMDDVVGHGVA